MVILDSYVKLPEGKWPLNTHIPHVWNSEHHHLVMLVVDVSEYSI